MSLIGYSSVLVLIFALVLSSLPSFTSQARRKCTPDYSIMKLGKQISKCKKLGTLDAELGWNYHNGTRNRTIDIFFGVRPVTTTGWIAWGVNPSSRPQMVGTRALIGFQEPNGSLVLDTYNITKEVKMGCRLQPFKPSEEFDFKVENQKITYLEEFLIISATITLPKRYNLTCLNHVWQVGSAVVDLQPLMHAQALQNVDSAETINITSGRSRKAGHQRKKLRKVHGILNIVGWGILLPAGAIIARYLRDYPFKVKGWYMLHASIQILAYLIGGVGWGIGIWLGNASKDSVFRTHRTFGVIIFTFTTLQVLALWLRPSKKDEYRRYWVIYHHLLGYGLIVVIIFNIFHGIGILKPDNQKWKESYWGILGTMGAVVLVLELYTWVKHIYFNIYKPSISSKSESSSGSSEVGNKKGLKPDGFGG